jgi:ABC-type lipoprotein export system ATPase subunit
MPARALARLRGSLVATVLQNPARNLLPYATVRQNLEFAQAPNSGHDRADQLLDQLDLRPLRDAIAGRLAGGEQQRVAIAAAIGAGARLVLADEPTSQLDANGRDEVVGLLEQVNRDFGATVVLVTHDPAVAARGARTVTIRDGRVGAEGRHGREYAVIGRDGTLQLPPDVLDALPPGTLLEIERRGDTINLTRRPGDQP